MTNSGTAGITVLLDAEKRIIAAFAGDPDQAQILARILIQTKCWFVTGGENRPLIESMGMRWSPDVNGALREASECLGADAEVTVIPDGVGVIVSK
ncbi:hypothetical protein FACS1894184_02540 [Clostridia bacterium]|nr:hypothetical protein FACS1894184_02540 [Clostridia bacterium]